LHRRHDFNATPVTWHDVSPQRSNGIKQNQVVDKGVTSRVRVWLSFGRVFSLRFVLLGRDRFDSGDDVDEVKGRTDSVGYFGQVNNISHGSAAVYKRPANLRLDQHRLGDLITFALTLPESRADRIALAGWRWQVCRYTEEMETR
jgi:hypothetical protein